MPIALVALPALAAGATVMGTTWFAGSDQGIEVLRIHDVGTSHTPLVGAYSRLGWSHPGPLLFWLLAPFDRLGGQSAVLVGTALVNAIGAALAVWAALRRGGLRFAAVVAVIVAVLLRGLGPDLLVDPWNPYVALVPFLALLLTCFAVSEGDVVLLPVVAALASFVVQCHLGYAPLVAAAIVFALVRARRADRLARWAAIAAAVLFVLWLPPLVQQVTGDEGNLAAIVDAQLDAEEPAVGWDDGLGAMGAQLRPWGPWTTGDDSTPSGMARTGAVAPALAVVVALLASTVWARRRGDRHAASLGALALVSVAAAVVTTARITGWFLPHLVRWWWAVAALAVLALAWAIVAVVSERILVPVAVAVTALLTVATLTQLPAAAPFDEVSESLEAMLPDVLDHLDDDLRYIVRGVDQETLNAGRVALLVALDRRGYDVFSDPIENAAASYGEWRVREPSDVDAAVNIVSERAIAAGWEPGADDVVIARTDGYRVYLGPP